MSKKDRVTGSYAYDVALPLVDYCGDIVSKKGRGTYSPTYSPNNIKRLIISPDAVEVHYHISLHTGEKRRAKIISATKLKRVQGSEDYKSVLSILYADHICASLEEVIILVPSKDNITKLTGRDLTFESMVSSYKAGGQSVSEAIKGRYKRLHEIAILDMTYADFMMAYKASMQDGNSYEFICDMPFMSVAKVSKFNTEPDWYKSYGSSGQFYELDKKGGRLNTYFSNLAVEKDKKKHAEEVRSYAKGCGKSAKPATLDFTELTNELKEFTKFYKSYAAFVKYIKESDTVIQLMGGKPITPKLSMGPVLNCTEVLEPVLKGYPWLKHLTEEDMGSSDDEENLRLTVIQLKKAKIRVLEALIHYYLDSWLELYTISPLTAKISFENSKDLGTKARVVLPSTKAKCAELDRIFGEEFSKGKKFVFYDLMSLCSTVFVEQKASDTKKYKWQGVDGGNIDGK